MSEGPSIVVVALVAEYKRMRNKLSGAAGRLKFAQEQVEIESRLLDEHTRDLHMLADALMSNGGGIPPDEERPVQ